MLKYLTSAAVLALVASTAMADPGGGKGGGNGGGGNPHAEDGGGKSGGGKAHAPGGNGGGGGDHGSPAARSPQKQAHEMRGPGRTHTSEPRGQGKAMAAQRRDEFRPESRGNRAEAFHADRSNERGNADLRDNRNQSSGWRWASAVPQRSRGLIAGCPPGLAKKNNGCLPPGLARARAARVFYDSPTWWNFDNRWHDNADWSGGDYRYYDGYLVRSGARGIDSWLPLLGGALAPGNLWPSQYQTTALPPYYQDYYGVGQPDGYRYYDDTLFRVDPQSNAITAITALLTGDNFQVGQRMPQGYDIYNVPTSYRDQYPQGPNSDYRYSDGTIYRVDPKTQLIQAAIGLLT